MDWGSIKFSAYQVIIAGDQLLNSMTGGLAEETLSSRCFRLNATPGYRVAEIVINTLFYPLDGAGHCELSYNDSRNRCVSFLTLEKAYAMNGARA